MRHLPMFLGQRRPNKRPGCRSIRDKSSSTRPGPASSGRSTLPGPEAKACRQGAHTVDPDPASAAGESGVRGPRLPCSQSPQDLADTPRARLASEILSCALTGHRPPKALTKQATQQGLTGHPAGTHRAPARPAPGKGGRRRAGPPHHTVFGGDLFVRRELHNRTQCSVKKKKVLVNIPGSARLALRPGPRPRGWGGLGLGYQCGCLSLTSGEACAPQGESVGSPGGQGGRGASSC